MKGNAPPAAVDAASPPCRVGYALAEPEGLRSCQSVFVCPCPAGNGMTWEAAICLVDGTLSEAEGATAVRLVRQSVEAALQTGRTPTPGACLAIALHEAAEALTKQSGGPEHPRQLRCSAGAAVLTGGNWTLIEAGGTHVFLERGRVAGPAFSHTQATDPALGEEGSAPRITSARAYPGDQVMLLGGYTAGCVDPSRAARVIRSAPSVDEGCKALAQHALAAHGTPQAVASIIVDPPPRRARRVLPSFLLSLAFLAAAGALAFLAWTGGPTRPVIPSEARTANLLPLAEGETAEQSSPEMSPGLVDMGLPDIDSALSDSGRVKIVGESGVCFEITDLASGEIVLEGQVNPGQDSFTSEGIPAPAQYSVSVWADEDRTETLVKDLEFHLERDAIRIVDSRRGHAPDTES